MDKDLDELINKYSDDLLKLKDNWTKRGIVTEESPPNIIEDNTEIITDITIPIIKPFTHPLINVSLEFVPVGYNNTPIIKPIKPKNIPIAMPTPDFGRSYPLY